MKFHFFSVLDINGPILSRYILPYQFLSTTEEKKIRVLNSVDEFCSKNIAIGIFVKLERKVNRLDYFSIK